MRCWVRGQARATVPALTVAPTPARHEGRTGRGNGKAHDTRRGHSEERTANETTNKRIKKEKKQVSNE